MGLFSKKSKKTPQIKREIPNNFISKNNEVEIRENDTYLEIRFPDYGNARSTGYDHTKLIVNKKSIRLINGKEVFDCTVSWYSANDVGYIDTQLGEYVRVNERNTRTHILAEIDLPRLKHNELYRLCFMRELLSKKRVNQYMQRRLEERPISGKCGRYIGGIMYDTKTGKFQEFFDEAIGKLAHNLPEVVEERRDWENKLRNSAKRQYAYHIGEADKLRKKLDRQQEQG